MSSAVAVIELGGKQHLVRPGARVVANRLGNAEGETFQLVDLLSNQSVQARIVGHELGAKVSGLKFKPKTRYLKRYGHRQQQTVVEIVSIGASTAAVAAPAQPIRPKTVAPVTTRTKVAQSAVAKKKASSVKPAAKTAPTRKVKHG